MNAQEQYDVWVNSGSPMPAPDYARTMAVLRLAKEYGINVFVETGTLIGSRVGAVKGFFKEVYSIELSPQLYQRCVDSFRNDENVHLYNGDSGIILPEILSKINEPCLYFLDAHYSAGTTARGNKDSALEDEFKTILPRLSIYNDVVLVDDTYDLADGNGYLSIDTISKMILNVRPDYSINEQDYILKAFPKR